ncbi:SDR family NAD(P)-dependent oxidoreductase [Fructilactobacillus sp. Tb1]|uniref:SDR family NAD(P)-dependent oxidoreductase n=1 Tax=Fructilactobacillus sp. Tb1 TaxID=3422304 RepID=UPI003D2A4CCB
MKTALVTGANRGIGFELTKDFLKNNINVIVAARTPENVRATIDKLSDIDTLANASGIVIDLNDKNTIQAAKHQFESNDLSLDYLVNNAGIAGDMSHGALKTTESDIKKTLDVNLFGTMEIIKAFLPFVTDAQGKIANLTGPYEAVKWYNPTAYRVSKVALDALIQSFAIDFKNNEIPVQIFGVFPGGVSTDINHHRQGPNMKTVEEAGTQIINLITNHEDYNGDIVSSTGQILVELK